MSTLVRTRVDKCALLCYGVDMQIAALTSVGKALNFLGMPKTRKSRQEPDTRLIGYARVSTEDQDLRAQMDALRKAGVMEANLYSDKRSGKNLKRPGLEAALLDCRPGDVLVIPALDRLARSVEDLIYLTNRLKAEEVALRSLRENMIDTTTPFGALFFHMMAALAQFERSLIGKRTRDAMAAAKERGVTLGAPATLTPKRLKRAVSLLRQGHSAEYAAKRVGVTGTRLRQKVLEVHGKPLWQTKPRKLR